MTPYCDNYQTAHFEISSNCLFCGNSDKNYAEKGGYQLIIVRIFNFQLMPSMSWRHAIKGMTNGSVVSIQEWNIFTTSMSSFIFTIFATTKHRASIHAWCWHEKKKSGSWPWSWYTESRRLIRWCLYLEANDEEETTVNDLIINIKNHLWLVMMIWHIGANIYMKSELNENFRDEMFMTELHGEMNAVTFCYIAASIVFLQSYSSTINQSTV